MNKTKNKFDPVECLHGNILKCFSEYMEKNSSNREVPLSSSRLDSIIAEAKMMLKSDHAVELIDTDLQKVLIQGRRIQKIKELEKEVDELKKIVMAIGEYFSFIKNVNLIPPKDLVKEVMKAQNSSVEYYEEQK